MDKYKQIIDKYEQELEQWKRNPNWEDTGEQLYYFHSHFRRECKTLLKSYRKNDFKQLCAGLHMHHQIEERSFFPSIQKRFNIDKKVMKSLVNDHNEMIELENKIHKAFEEKDDQVKELIEEFVYILLAHLCEEELALIPFMLQVKEYVL